MIFVFVLVFVTEISLLASTSRDHR